MLREALVGVGDAFEAMHAPFDPHPGLQQLTPAAVGAQKDVERLGVVRDETGEEEQRPSVSKLMRRPVAGVPVQPERRLPSRLLHVPSVVVAPTEGWLATAAKTIVRDAPRPLERRR